MAMRGAEHEPVRDDYDFQVLHEEIERLPRRYREPIVLCYLEGMTLETAAGQLGCPIGTVGVRLMRARERLKARLSRPGVSSPGGLFIAGLSSRPASAALPCSLVRSTMGATIRFATGGTISLAVGKLTNEVLRSMAVIKLTKVTAAVLAVSAAVASSGGLLVHSRILAAQEPANERLEPAPAFWVGQTVVPKYSTPLRDGDRVVDDGSYFRIYTVDQINGDRIRLASAEVSGWVQASEIVALDQAIDFFTKEIRSDPNNGAAHHYRALIWETQGEHDKAISDLTEAIRINPESAATFVVRGNIFLKHKEDDGKAIADYDEAIRLEPAEFAVAYSNRGLAWSAKGEFDKAIADFTEAIKLGVDAWAYNQRGRAWGDKGEHDKALADLNRAIRLDPKDAWAYLNRGNVWQAKQEYDKAMADFGEAIRLDPKFAFAYNARGGAWQDKREYDKALADYSEAIRLDPKYHDAYANRGNAWRDKQEYDKALADYSEAIRLDPKYVWAYANRGIVWHYKREYDKALADYSEAIRLDPKYHDAYAARARTWATCRDAKCRDGKKAVESATKACELAEWKDAAHLAILAAAYAELGDFDSAVKWQIKANELYRDAAVKTYGEAALKLYREKKPFRDAEP